MDAGTGMFVYDPTDTAITNITQTLSEYFAGGPTPYHYADGLGALSNSTSVFSQATSKTDPTTHQLYWNEIEIAQGLPSSSGSIAASQLESLAAAGITSISLAGSGNSGESIAGSAVTDRTVATTGTGSDQVAAVNFQTDTTGDVTVNANGGVTIDSSAEGGPTTSSSFVDMGTSGSSFRLTNGTLVNTATNTVVSTGTTAVFATTQNDVITVASTDATPYWLGGGTGAATLTGGAENTMFLVNSTEFANPTAPLVHGGTGFNIAQVTDSAPVDINLATDNLQEVVGGAGDGTFNASGTTDNVFIQGGSGNIIIIGGAAQAGRSSMRDCCKLTKSRLQTTCGRAETSVNLDRVGECDT
jgi:hypothetical protein